MAVRLTSILNIHFCTPNIHFPSLGSAGNGRYKFRVEGFASCGFMGLDGLGSRV